jgi:hypothetical protein
MFLASDFKVAWPCAHITGCLFGPVSAAARGIGERQFAHRTQGKDVLRVTSRAVLASGWTSEGSELESHQESSLLCVVRTKSVTHPTSYPKGNGDKVTGT